MDKRLQEKKRGKNSCCQISGVLTPCNLPPSKNSGREFEVADFISETYPQIEFCPSSFGKRSCKESNFCKKNTTKKLQNIQEIDVKRFAKVEKIQGGELSDCKVPLRVIFVWIFWEKILKKSFNSLLVLKKWNSGWCFFVKIWNLDCIIRLIWLKFWFSPDFAVFFFMVNDALEVQDY